MGRISKTKADARVLDIREKGVEKWTREIVHSTDIEAADPPIKFEHC